MDNQIKGIEIHPLERFDDQRGAVLKYVSEKSPFFDKISEVYFSTLHKDVVKGWRKHLTTTQHFCVPFGEIKLVVVDDRENSSTYKMTKEFIVGGIDNYNLVVIPPHIYYSFKGLKSEGNLVTNYIDAVYNHEETISLELKNSHIQYQW